MMQYPRRKKKYPLIILSLILLIFCTLIHAQTTVPIFIITPSASSATLSPSGSATVDYTVTNNSSLPVSGILIASNYNISPSFLTVTTTNNTCTGTLNPNASCTFTANLQGTGQSGSILLMPQVCGSNGMMCSVPALNNRVAVTVTSSATITSISPSSGPTTGGQTVVITGVNFTGATSVTFGGTNALSYTVNSSTKITAVTPPGTAGVVSVVVTTPHGTATGTYTYYQGNAYVFNQGTQNISVCAIIPNGDFSSCGTTTGGISFNTPFDLVMNPAGSFLYLSDDTGVIYYCPLANGVIGNCQIATISIPSPVGLAINPAGTILYVTNGSDTVYRCEILPNGSLGSCPIAGNGFHGSDGIAINPADTIAYIVNFDNDSVSKCLINSDGGLTSCITTGNGFGSPISIAINRANTFVYVINFTDDTASRCPIKSDGSFDTCTKTGNGAFSGGISINPTDTIAYIADYDTSEVSKCTIDTTNGNFVNPCVTTGSDFSSPVGISVAPGS